jgi:hypothetical protein
MTQHGEHPSIIDDVSHVWCVHIQHQCKVRKRYDKSGCRENIAALRASTLAMRSLQTNTQQQSSLNKDGRVGAAAN